MCPPIPHLYILWYGIRFPDVPSIFLGSPWSSQQGPSLNFLYSRGWGNTYVSKKKKRPEFGSLVSLQRLGIVAHGCRPGARG